MARLLQLDEDEGHRITMDEVAARLGLTLPDLEAMIQQAPDKKRRMMTVRTESASMTDTLLALFPTYRVWLVFGSVCWSCLAVPLPSSVLLLSAGGFAATGDLVLSQVIIAAFVGFILGDHIAYFIARSFGPSFLARLKSRKSFVGPLTRAETMLVKRGGIAIFLCHTIFSPVGPYMNYLCAAAGLRWIKFFTASVPGAALWVGTYAYIGYGVTGQLSQYAGLFGTCWE